MRTREAILVACLAFAAAPAGAADDGVAAPVQEVKRTAEQLASLRRFVLDGLADPRPNVRVSAAQAIVAAWPDSAPILDEALSSRSAGVRLEAVNLLGEEVMGDQRERIQKKLDDADTDVRRQAIRIARRLKWPEIEPSLIRIVGHDSEWIVRQEALRGLESLGTLKCLRTVLDGWIAERNEEHRRHYKRVLVGILKLDCGEDEAAWRDAIQKAETDSRVARK